MSAWRKGAVDAIIYNRIGQGQTGGKVACKLQFKIKCARKAAFKQSRDQGWRGNMDEGRKKGGSRRAQEGRRKC